MVATRYSKTWYQNRIVDFRFFWLNKIESVIPSVWWTKSERKYLYSFDSGRFVAKSILIIWFCLLLLIRSQFNGLFTIAILIFHISISAFAQFSSTFHAECATEIVKQCIWSTFLGGNPIWFEQISTLSWINAHFFGAQKLDSIPSVMLKRIISIHFYPSVRIS